MPEMIFKIKMNFKTLPRQRMGIAVLIDIIKGWRAYEEELDKDTKITFSLHDK